MTSQEAREIVEKKQQERFAKINPEVLKEVYQKIEEAANQEQSYLKYEAKSQDEVDYIYYKLRNENYYVSWVNRKTNSLLLQIIW